MTAQQQTTQSQTQSAQPVTIDQVDTDNVKSLLKSQTTIDPEARGDTYIPIQETNLPTLTLEELSEGILLYNPRNPTVLLEVLDQYQDDFGKEKIRTRVHSNDHRNGRLHSYFAPHVLRDFTYFNPEEDDLEVELSVDALTSAWDGDTTDDEDETLVQTTIGKGVDEPDEPASKPVEGSTSDTDTLEQQTLF